MTAEPAKKFIPCPLCHESRFLRLFVKDGVNFVRCRGCALISINPQPEAEELDRLYGKDYYRPWGLEHAPTQVAEMKEETFSRKLREIERYACQGKILDIGCATGFFLGAAQRRGWEPYGVEISAYAARIAGEIFGPERVFNGPLEQAGYPSGHFEAAFMSDLIEHIKEPRPFLKELHRITAAEGIIGIVTPDSGSISFRLMGRQWPHCKREHLYYYSAPVLERLLNQEGFRVISVAPARKSLSFDYINRHLAAYPVFFLTPALKLLAKFLPAHLAALPFRLPTGEMFILARKVH